jgi:CheY-like chemotaxis protein
VETILVVDDEDAIRAVVRKVLEANHPDTPGAGQGLGSKVRDRRRSAGGDPPGVLGVVREP